MKFLLTTDPGIEEIAAAEVREKLPGAGAVARPYGCPGQVGVETSGVDGLLRLTTIHHVIEVRGESEILPLDGIRSWVRGLPFPELADAASFRVSSRLVGNHDVGKLELQRAGGGVLHERYGTPVDLEGFEINVRVDLYANQLVAGIQETRDSLGNRVERVRPLRSAIKPTIAAAMLRLAGAHRGGGVLIDPMCGSGTIPIEAARANPGLDVRASDWDAETLEVARETMARHRVEVEPRLADARRLGETDPGRFDYIVTNPPYGVRQARRTSISRLYRALLPSFARAVRDSGRIVMVVVKYRAFLAALEGSGLRVAAERVVAFGGLEPRIYLLEQD